MLITSSSGMMTSKASSSAMIRRMCLSESQLGTVSVLVSGPTSLGSRSSTAPMVWRSFASEIMKDLDVRYGGQPQLRKRGAISPLPIPLRHQRQPKPVVEVPRLRVLGSGPVFRPNRTAPACGGLPEERRPHRELDPAPDDAAAEQATIDDNVLALVAQHDHPREPRVTEFVAHVDRVYLCRRRLHQLLDLPFRVATGGKVELIRLLSELGDALLGLALAPPQFDRETEGGKVLFLRSEAPALTLGLCALAILRGLGRAIGEDARREKQLLYMVNQGRVLVDVGGDLQRTHHGQLTPNCLALERRVIEVHQRVEPDVELGRDAAKVRHLVIPVDTCRHEVLCMQDHGRMVQQDRVHVS